jgi:hypothetical protein
MATQDGMLGKTVVCWGFSVNKFLQGIENNLRPWQDIDASGWEKA